MKLKEEELSIIAPLSKEHRVENMVKEETTDINLLNPSTENMILKAMGRRRGQSKSRDNILNSTEQEFAVMARKV